jgi:DNA-binding LytR/AlgR family response regulator
MERIKVLIVEDSVIVAESIAALLEKHGLEVADKCRSGKEALAAFEQRKPDLVLMDIQLEGDLDGIAVAAEIVKRSPLPIIYLSDYTDGQTVSRAKKTFPANYLSKPFNQADLIRAIDIAFTNHNAQRGEQSTLLPDYIFVRTDSQKYEKVAYSDIVYLKAERAYCKIVMEEKTLTLSSSMNNIHEQLNHRDFMRVHRSYVINTKKITSIEGRVVHLGTHTVQINEESYRLLTRRLTLLR